MKRNTRKGFTGIELVIVIAIIAILAASLIPAFGGLFDSANKTADLQAAREMDMAIKLAAAGEDLTIQEVIVILDEAGFDVTSLKPLYKHNAFYWNEEKDYIVLWDKEAEEVVYPEGGEMPLVGTEQGDLLSKGACYFVAEVATADDFYAAIESGTSIKLTDNMTIDRDISINNANVTLDLGGKRLSSVQNSNGRSSVIKIEEGNSLTVTNGTFVVRSLQNHGTLTVKADVEIHAVDITGGGCIRNKPGCEVIIEGGKFYVDNYEPWSSTGNKGGAAGVYNDGGKVTIEDGTFVSNTAAYLIANVSGGEMIINGGDFTAFRGALYNSGSQMTVNGGSFKVTNGEDGGWLACHEGTGSLTINGGTFESVTANKLNGVTDNR